MDAVSRSSGVAPKGWIDVNEDVVRASHADCIVSQAQLAADQWGNHSETLLKCTLAYWMFSCIAAYTGALMVQFAASVAAYKASEKVVANPFVQPVASAAHVVTRTTAATASLTKGWLAAQFEGQNSAYRPSMGDLSRSVVKLGITNVVFSPKTATVGA